MSEYLFKATTGNNATYGGTYTYRKNRWTHHETPVLCESGWHLAEGKQVLKWLAPTLWLAEIHPDAKVVRGDNKLVASKIRVVERLDTWDDRTARLFAADCAEDALALLLDPDPRSVEAVAVARRFANGNATQAELDIARAAAEDAARAAREACRSRSARAAAWDAAGNAAEVVAWAAAWNAASKAARAAAEDAAEAAAAWAAVGATAEAAASTAVWVVDDAVAAAEAAARATVRNRQYQRLLRYLELPKGADDG